MTARRRVRRIDELPPGEVAQLLLASVTDCAIYALDPGGCVTSWNAGAERIKGYVEGEILGQHFSIFHSPDARAAGEPDRELLGAASGRYESEGWRLRKDGTRFWASVTLTGVFAPNGTLIGFAKVTRELTERRSAGPHRHLAGLGAQIAHLLGRARRAWLRSVDHARSDAVQVDPITLRARQEAADRLARAVGVDLGRGPRPVRRRRGNKNPRNGGH